MSGTAGRVWVRGGIRHHVGRNQSRSQNTVIKFPNPHAKFPLTQPTSFRLSQPTLFHSLVHSLLCSRSAFISLYLPWYPIQPRRSGYSFYSLASLLLYTFQSLSLLLPSSLSYPLSLIPPPCPWLLAVAYFTMAHIKRHKMKETLSACFVFQRYDHSQGHIVWFFFHKEGRKKIKKSSKRFQSCKRALGVRPVGENVGVRHG